MNTFKKKVYKCSTRSGQLVKISLNCSKLQSMHKSGKGRFNMFSGLNMEECTICKVLPNEMKKQLLKY